MCYGTHHIADIIFQWSRQGEVEESDYAPSSDAEIEEPAPVIVPKKRVYKVSLLFKLK